MQGIVTGIKVPVQAEALLLTASNSVPMLRVSENVQGFSGSSLALDDCSETSRCCSENLPGVSLPESHTDPAKQVLFFTPLDPGENRVLRRPEPCQKPFGGFVGSWTSIWQPSLQMLLSHLLVTPGAASSGADSECHRASGHGECHHPSLQQRAQSIFSKHPFQR